MNGIASINERVPDRANAGHDKFIPTNAEPNDWASQSSTQETGLWGGKYTDYEWHDGLRHIRCVPGGFLSGPFPGGFFLRNYFENRKS